MLANDRVQKRMSDLCSTALTFSLFLSPPDDPTHGANGWLEIGGGETDGLDEGGPGNRVLELQDGDVVRHVIVEVLVNHNLSDHELRAVIWEVLDTHLYGVVCWVLGSAGPGRSRSAVRPGMATEIGF